MWQESAASESPAKRTVIVYAVKFMAVDKPHPIDALLHAAMPGFLSHLSDTDWCDPLSGLSLMLTTVSWRV